MDGIKGWQKEMPLAALNTQKDLANWATGCDKDIGGFSEAKLELTPEGKGKFHGNISLELPTNQDIKQSGYAAIRTKVETKRNPEKENELNVFIAKRPDPVRNTLLGYYVISLFSFASERG